MLAMLAEQQLAISRLQETVQALVEMPAPAPMADPETRELLLEVLSSLQTPVEQDLSQRLGLSTQPL